MTMVEALRQRTLGGPEIPIDFADDLLGQKVIVPMFSRGLQGVVMGLFTDVPKTEREPILTTLLEFGETISDVYADLRLRHFMEAVEEELTEKELAREVINIISPISRIIVMRQGRRAGYKLGYESNYWSGYHALSNEELYAAPSPISFTVIGPNGSEIYIEPLRDVPALNTEFTRLRLENYLNQTVGAITTAQNGEALSLDEVQQLRSEFEAYTKEDNASLAKLRQYYVVLKVENNWEAGNVKVTNNELKRFLETELSRELKNGYQVTSFVGEFEKIFEEKVLITKATRNTLSLSWRRSG